MTRPDGWETRLSDCVEDTRSAPFVWGWRDCATWAFDVRRALTGQDAAAAWRGRYSTPLGAARMLRRLGVTSVEGLARLIMGAPLDAPELAQRGDLMLAGDEDALGVCIGPVGLFLAPQGMTPRPLSSCRLAWRV